MALPGIQSVTILDGSLGIIPDDTTGIHVKMGVCSSGNVNQLYSFTSTQDVKTTLGSGKLVDALAAALDIAGGPIYAMRLNASVAGTVSQIQASLVTTPTASDAALAVSGSPTNDYQVVVQISRAGKVGTTPYPTFQYSLDNGLTFSDQIVIPAGGVYAIPQTGITLTFTTGVNGAFVGDVWKFSTTAATWNNTNVGDGFVALLQDSRTWGFVHLVGVCDTTIASTVASYMTTAQTNERYVHTVVEARDMNFLASLETAAQTFPMTFAGGETLKILISNDFGVTFPITRTFTFPAVAYANINALVTALNVQSFTGGLFTVSASTSPATGLTIATQSIKGKTQLKVDATSTGIGGGLIQFTGNQLASGETEDAWMNSLIGAWVNFVSDRVSVFAGPCDIYSSISREYNVRNGAFIMTGRESLIPIREDLGKVARGALPLILTPEPNSNKYGIYHDEDAKPGLDVSRFSTTRKFKNLPGFFITNGRTFALPGSDFTYLQYRRVIDRAATLLTIISKQFINTEVRVNKDGTIFEIDAGGIEDKVTNFMYADLKDNIVALEVQVDRTINVLSSQKIKITASIRPFGYIKFIDLVVGFTPVITA